MDEGRTDQLVFFAFDVLHLDGASVVQLPLIERKQRLQHLFRKPIPTRAGCAQCSSDKPPTQSAPNSSLVARTLPLSISRTLTMG